MNMDSWIIMTDKGRAGGMLAAVRKLGGRVTAAVVGPRSLAEAVAALGPDRVLWFPLADGLPAEAYAAPVAEAARTAAPRVLLVSDAPAGRILLGAAATGLEAAIVSPVRDLALDGDTVLATRPTAEGRALETLATAGALAGIFDGDDVSPAGPAPAPVEEASTAAPVAALRLLDTQAASADSAGLLTATRVVGAGLGVKAKADLQLIEGPGRRGRGRGRLLPADVRRHALVRTDPGGRLLAQPDRPGPLYRRGHLRPAPASVRGCATPRWWSPSTATPRPGSSRTATTAFLATCTRSSRR